MIVAIPLKDGAHPGDPRASPPDDSPPHPPTSRPSAEMVDPSRSRAPHLPNWSTLTAPADPKKGGFRSRHSRCPRPLSTAYSPSPGVPTAMLLSRAIRRTFHLRRPMSRQVARVASKSETPPAARRTQSMPHPPGARPTSSWTSISQPICSPTGSSLRAPTRPERRPRSSTRAESKLGIRATPLGGSPDHRTRRFGNSDRT